MATLRVVAVAVLVRVVGAAVWATGTAGVAVSMERVVCGKGAATAAHASRSWVWCRAWEGC
eukprot:scaffold214927_cov15-Tisochrysis_lutea.AAC.1